MRNCNRSVINTVIVALTLVLVAPLMGQETRSEIAIQGTGFFTKDSSGNGMTQKGTFTGGILASYRYRVKEWLSAEAAYGWNQNTQLYTTSTGSGRLQANVHQATGGFVVSVPAPRRFAFNPYLLAEGGALVFAPTNNAYSYVPGASRQAVGAFVYGGGVDYPMPAYRNISFRLEYRGLIYNAPDFGLHKLHTGAVTHTAEPSAGLVYRF